MGWKLDLVLRGEAGQALLESYNDEAITTADENILNSTRSTDFLTPKTTASKAFRDAVLELASTEAFARPFVNSGRLSTAIHYPQSSLNTPDAQAWNGGVAPGSPALDAPANGAWLLPHLGGRFVLLANGWTQSVPADVELVDIAQWPGDHSLLQSRYALQSGSGYLIRPDHYVAARWQSPVSAAAVQASVARAKGVQQ